MKLYYKALLPFIISNFFIISCATTKVERPVWVTNPESEFPDREFLVQKASAKSKDEAKNEALSAISYYLDSKVSGIRESNFHSINEDTSQEIIRNTSVTTDLTLFGVEYTEPWYDSKSKNWYVLCYINRETAWTQFRPELQSARDKVFGFYDKALECKDGIEKIRFFSSALQEMLDFTSKYSYAQMFSEELTSANYREDLKTLAKIKSLQQEEKNNTPIYIQIQNDMDSTIYNAISSGFSESGFTVTNNKSDCIAYVEIEYNSEIRNDTFFYSPTVQLELLNNGSSVYSYSDKAKSVKAFTEKVGKTKALNELSERIQENFSKDFNAKLGGKK